MVVPLEKTGDLESDALGTLGHAPRRRLTATLERAASIESGLTQEKKPLIDPAGLRVRIVKSRARAERIRRINGQSPDSAGVMLVSGGVVRALRRRSLLVQSGHDSFHEGAGVTGAPPIRGG